MLTILIDPARLGTQARFEQEALAFADWLRVAPAANGQKAVLLAGDPERAQGQQRTKDGIEIDAPTWQEWWPPPANVA